MLNDIMTADALRYMGITGSSKDEEMLTKVKDTFNRLEILLKPKSVYGIFELKKGNAQISLANTSCTITSPDLLKLLKDSSKAVLMAATLGADADREISLMQKISMLDAVIYDACCSVMIDKVCDDLEQKIIKGLLENEFLTMRYSPGYGDVPLTLSREILSILNAQKQAGLTLTDTDMLVPSKSVTAIIGISDKKQNRQRTCGKCSLVKTCVYRKRGDRCGL